MFNSRTYVSETTATRCPDNRTFVWILKLLNTIVHNTPDRAVVVTVNATTVFPRIDRARTVYFSALIGARTNRGRSLIEGAVYYCD